MTRRVSNNHSLYIFRERILSEVKRGSCSSQPRDDRARREKCRGNWKYRVVADRGRHCFRHGSLATTLLQSNGREAWKRGRCISRNYPARYQTGQKLQFFAIYRWRRDRLVPVSVRVLSQDPRTKTPFLNRNRKREREILPSHDREKSLHYIYIYILRFSMLSNSVRFLVSPLSTHSFPLLSLFRFGILILVPNFLKIRPILAKERKRERKNVRFSRITRAENNRIREGNCIREASCHEPHVQVSTEQLRATLPFRFLTLPGHLRPPPAPPPRYSL